MTYSSSDTAITAIKRADSLPNGFTPAAENTVSANNSELPIYIFFDDTDGTMYYYSAADDIYLNTDSSNMFSKLESLADISGFSDVDTSEVKYMVSMFENCTTLPSINALSNWDTSKVTSTYRMFKSCTALTNIGGVSDWDVTSVNTMRNMFGDCTNLANINGTSNWNTSNVTDMRGMFDGCTNLANINGVSNWDTSSVTLMGNMFEGCKSLTSISALSNWNTSRVTSMAYMFSGCSALTNVEGASLWDTSALTSISNMFNGCTNLANINGVSDWDTSKVTGMSTAFSDCRALTNINALADWDLSNVTEMASMFQRCTSLENIDGAKYWNAPKLTNISNLFANDAKASGTIQLLSNPSSYGGAFSGAATSSGSEITVNYNCTITANIDAIVATKSSTSHVVKGSCASSSFTVFDTGVEVNIKMKKLANSIATATYSTEDTAIHAIKRSNSLPSGFTPATENTISISSSEYPIYIYFDDTDGTLYYYSEANTVYLNPISANLFYNFKGLTDISGLSSVDSSKVVTMTSMFYQCPITNINALASWDTSHVSNMNYMFQNCSSLENINGASNWDTSNVITMQAMFLYDSSLTNINGVSNWDTSNVTNMGNMFTSTSSLTNLDALANWNVSNVSNVAAMFNVCTALEDISGISNWNTSNLDNISSIFSSATKVSGTFPILGNPSSYDGTFYRSATQSGAQVTVKYSCDITTKIDDIIATKSSNSNVVKANECTEVYRQFKIRNKIFGNMANTDKSFSYTAVVRDEDDVIVPEMGSTFTLKNDEREIINIPDGYKITVEQASEVAYTTTVDNTNTRTITKTINGDEDIIFKNAYDISVDTGVKTIIPPYIVLLLLSILTLLGIGYISKKLELD